ncbi:MAG: type 4a pilus biogenesis protein PilO [Planctomycetota bacterium]
MATWTQKKMLVGIVTSSVVLCLSAGGGIWYALGLIEETTAQVTEKEQAVAAADARIKLVPGLEKDVIILRENLGEYVKILPDTKELTAFVRMLNLFDKQSGIKSNGLRSNRRAENKGERFTPIEYTYEVTATLWQCLKFMNLIETFDRFVSITDFSISSGAEDRTAERREGDVVHKVRLTLQTYQYNGRSEGKEAQIPDYDEQRAALRDEIWKNMQAIRLDRYLHRGQQGRRDVLIDPRERGDMRLEGPSPAEQRAVLEKFVGEIARLREMQGKIKRQDTTLFEQYSLEKGLKEGLEKLTAALDTEASRVTYAPYRLRWAQEVVAPLDELRGQMDAVAKAEAKTKDPFLPLKDLQQLVTDLAADCTSGQLEQAKNRYEAIGARLAVPADDARHALAVDAKSWHHKASTALDFKGLDLKVQGVVVNRTGGRSGVLLNGEVYEEGEFVSDDLLVKMVEEEQVWFVFRGLTLVRTM